ncbi:DoxX family protein [Epilithonimonas sp.]|uniref:DoxX family protein n=1 Tax=Epilithonimonas sp. TaxID=2894511 RepID=UPI0028972488|nr:DoxX family protein [Epilithonimonas sp.]
MKNINSTKPNSNLTDIMILVIRVSVGLSMLTHGIPKLETLVTSNHIEFMSFLGMGPIFSMVLAVFAEFLCSLFMIFGLFTRMACVPLMITMLVACFVAHGADTFKEQELSVLYFFLYFVILILGPGKFSIDHFLTKKEEVY